MTISAAWIRTINSCEELIFVSDSRLSGDGRNFDACPKILTLPRSDCAIAFAGYSGAAYPMMQQLALAIDSHAPARRRSLDLTSLKSHALKVFDSMAAEIRVSPHLKGVVDALPGAEFLFGGYDWIKKGFEIWSIRYDSKQQKFIAHPGQTLVHLSEPDIYSLRPSRKPRRGTIIGRIAFAGDQAPLACEKFLEIYKTRPKSMPFKIDWEPFEVIRDMLRDPRRSETIGGPPQLVKVYQYMDAAVQGIFWPSKEEGRIHLQGRPCLGYERIERFIMDPDTLRSEAMTFTPVSTETV
ncbi:hypothetical protein [Methylobacterium longum]|uniref:Uncharacterized protein n=1 Tax=Methylobacterium longum TaxID=767694 RepID=A0ABT8AT39_9HYPH|nr:hypothetical protein [Methylobacterium longum]MDN3573098.1 hypothetical protein [Methylobacterium longum]GJE12093.1 hypothetical protein FOHLNKBM_3139 [Methylobacterium longum]